MVDGIISDCVASVGSLLSPKLGEGLSKTWSMNRSAPSLSTLGTDRRPGHFPNTHNNSVPAVIKGECLPSFICLHKAACWLIITCYPDVGVRWISLLQLEPLVRHKWVA